MVEKIKTGRKMKLLFCYPIHASLQAGGTTGTESKKFNWGHSFFPVGQGGVFPCEACTETTSRGLRARKDLFSNFKLRHQH